MKLSYDGKGINDKGQEYSPRIATFSDPDSADRFGNLFAASPDVLKCLRAIVLNWELLNEEHFSGPSAKLYNTAVAAIATAEGRKR